MERVEQTIDEELDYMEEMLDARDDAAEERNLIECDSIEEDEDYLYNLERRRRMYEKEKVKGSVKEPSLVVCWVIVIIVSMYVVFLLVAGDKDKQSVKDELWYRDTTVRDEKVLQDDDNEESEILDKSL